MEIKIKKGLDLPVAGGIDPMRTETAIIHIPQRVAIAPEDYPGFLPKVDIKAGDKVEPGSALMHDKANPSVCLVSPVSGTVAQVVRGERRKVLRVVVDVDKTAQDEWQKNATGGNSVEFADGNAVAQALAKSGLLAMMRQRPYDIVPNPNKLPRNIFVTALDTAPLAQDYSYYYQKEDILTVAVKLLSKVATHNIYISRRKGSACPDVPGATMVDITGPHPAGLVGTQISKIDPIVKGDIVWTMDIQTLIKVGQLAQGQKVDWRVCASIVGSCVVAPRKLFTYPGAPVEWLIELANGIKGNENARIISGNMLTGIKVDKDGFLHWPYTQLTVIPEGDDHDEFMGWASLSPKRMSQSPSYPGFWFHKLFNPDARVRGGRRAMIMSGIYENLIPLDIQPEYLIKAIASGDIDNMERLGIYEVAPEDFALAEYADTSKLPLQQMVRAGLDAMRKEVE